MTYEVGREWGVRRPDGQVVPMLNEDIARGFADHPTAGFTLVSRVVAHIPWTADLDVALAEVERLRATCDVGPRDSACDRCIPGVDGRPVDVRTYRHAEPCVHVQRGSYL